MAHMQCFGMRHAGNAPCPSGRPVGPAMATPAAAHLSHPALKPLLEFKSPSAAHHRRVTASSSSAAAASSGGGVGVQTPKPSAAETARTIVDLVAHGTLCTLGEDGAPLGTYVSYVLDDAGQPILRLRADAVHTANLRRDAKCSLFVQPSEHPARLLARVTLIGGVEAVGEEVAARAAELHASMHAGGIGVDAPQPGDLYYRLAVDRCFYVGQLSGDCAADDIGGGEYRSADPDPLRTCAAALAQHMNSARLEDVMRIASHALNASFEDLAYAELLWVDRLGVYLRAVGRDGGARTLRVPFAREIEDERDARSALTMMAQVAWEAERAYVPAAPTPVASGAES